MSTTALAPEQAMRVEAATPHLSMLLQDAARYNTGLKISYPFRVDSSSVEDLSYKDLQHLAHANKAHVNAIAQKKRTNIVLMHFENHTENFEIFWSIVLAGCIPAISTPFSTDAEQRHAHLSHLKSLLGDPVCLTSERLLHRHPEMRRMAAHTIEEVHEQRNLSNGEADFSSLVDMYRPSDGNQPDVLMLTSGSTGFAKAVPLRVPQILSSVKGKSATIGSHQGSKFLNWIGLDHVANLLEIHLQAMYLAADQVHVHANDLIADPLVFIRLIDENRITHTFGPNFFLAMLEKDLISAIKNLDPVQNADLSCLEAIVTGGEANVVETVSNLTALLARLGARGQVIWPAYSLTEACAALTYGQFDPQYEAAEAHEFASIGKPFAGAVIRVINLEGRLAKPYELGLIEIGGSVVFNKYYNNDKATEEAFTDNGWFITGDRGYMDSWGKFNLAGREKEVVVINGVKYAPHDIESVLNKAKLPSAIFSYFAAFAFRKESRPTEEYCIIYGSTEPDNKDLVIDTAERISKITSGLVGARPLQRHSSLAREAGEVVPRQALKS